MLQIDDILVQLFSSFDENVQSWRDPNTVKTPALLSISAEWQTLVCITVYDDKGRKANLLRQQAHCTGEPLSFDFDRQLQIGTSS